MAGKGSKNVTITLHGMDKLKRNLLELQGRAVPVMGKALREFGEEVMADSKEHYVPVDKGTLRASGYVKGPTLESKGLEVELGFGGAAAPYALSVHENPRAGQTGGVSPRGKKYQAWAKVGQWKYLEAPVLAWAGRLRGRLQEALNHALR